MARERFSRRIIASSDPRKAHAHRATLKENHEKNKEYFESIHKTVNIKQGHFNRKFFVKCFGKLQEITELEAKNLGLDLVTIL